MLNVVVNRSLDGKFKKLQDIVEGFQEEYLRGMSDQIVLRSPVDTGTYMDGHNLKTSAVPQTESSSKKPRNQPYGPHADDALLRLYMQASALPRDANKVVFSNDAFHADAVEYNPEHSPYRTAAREHNNIAREAEARAKARNR